MIFYRVYDAAVEVRPGTTSRDWMDATNEAFAYRCLPLTIANACGWELLLPCDVEAEWNGGPRLSDVSVKVGSEIWSNGRLAASHFGHGVLTFHTGYVIRTGPGTAILVRGVPNWPRAGIAPLEGLVETDWLNFSFTMNWMFTAPGKVSFKAGEPFSFLMPVQLAAVETIEPRIIPLAEAPDVDAEFRQWAALRNEFNARLAAREPEAVKERWQKWYTRGVNPVGEPSPTQHRSKLHIKPPRG